MKNQDGSKVVVPWRVAAEFLLDVDFNDLNQKQSRRLYRLAQDLKLIAKLCHASDLY